MLTDAPGAFPDGKSLELEINVESCLTFGEQTVCSLVSLWKGEWERETSAMYIPHGITGYSWRKKL